MNVESTQIYDAALSLPDTQRADLALALLTSLKPSTVLKEGSAAFVDEVNRRVEAYDAGEGSASDGDTVSIRLRQALENRKSS